MKKNLKISAFVLNVCVLALLSTQAHSVESENVRVNLQTSQEGIVDMKTIYRCITTYRQRNDGRYPTHLTSPSLFADIDKAYEVYGFENSGDIFEELKNPDVRYSTEFSGISDPDNLVAYLLFNTRADGSLYGSPKARYTRDQLAYTTIYNYLYRQPNKGGRPIVANYGHALVLWDDGQVEKIPYDEVFRYRGPNGYIDAFPNEAGVPGDRCFTYQEYWTNLSALKYLPLRRYPSGEGKLSQIVPDNGGPESFVAFSRLLSYPDRYGIERENLWKEFSLTQENFSLEEVRTHANALGLPLQLRQIPLAEIQRLNVPVLFLNDEDKRIITLSTLDDKEAIIIDRGLTRVVSREILEKRYGGEALMSQAVTDAIPQIEAEDPIRVINLESVTEEVTQQVTLTNRGTQPLTLQIEGPIPGVTEAKLSADTIAPGQTATLSLQIVWRDVLKGDSQDVFVFVKTNDPLRPRLPLGFELRAPQAK